MRCETLTFLSSITRVTSAGNKAPVKAITYLVPVPGFDIETIANKLERLLACRGWKFARERESVDIEPWELPRCKEILGTICELRFLNPELVEFLELLD